MIYVEESFNKNTIIKYFFLLYTVTKKSTNNHFKSFVRISLLVVLDKRPSKLHKKS